MNPDRPLLVVVPTPIGNLGDITLRALDALRQSDLVAAEDTRRTLRLLQHHGITGKHLVSYHEHNEIARAQDLLREMESGRAVALVTDAGMPGISDPSYRLVRGAIERCLPYTVLPGASAVTTAWAGCGFGGGGFHFGGFLPVKPGARRRALEDALGRPVATLVFESPHRIARALGELAELDPSHPCCVARELSKQFEEYRHGTAADLAAHFAAHPAKGEIVLIVDKKNG